ncbi:hypothetical protein BGW38_008573 [Lunasporangiospora selenospora]|uniref:Uncharacterized protein n=1 Tax=Lunasporangiospora selenospora TaxID=979761 RepID=A0A9P6FL70_9FUNG|nr:hypothetical protein BGW38_008573 [Lunasporangiospora selenospora]
MQFQLFLGLCLHPWKNSSPGDYHTLVVTPGEEEGPLLDQGGPGEGGIAAAVTISDDYKDAEHPRSGETSAEGTSNIRESKQQLHLDQEEQFVTSTIITEFIMDSDDLPTKTTALGEDHDDDHTQPREHPQEISVQETIVERSIPEMTDVIVTSKETESVPEVPSKDVLFQTTTSTTITTTNTVPSSPNAQRGKSFSKKFSRRSASQNSSQAGTPPGSGNTSPLMGRFSKFTKMMRPSETSTTTTTITSASTASSLSSSGQSKVESLQVSSPAPVAIAVLEKSSERHEDFGPVSPVNSPWTDGGLPLPQQQRQEHRGRKETTIMTVTTLTGQPETEEPMELPGQLTPPKAQPAPVKSHPWAIPNRMGSLNKTGRTPTVDSTQDGSEAGSVGSGAKDSNVPTMDQKRRKSVLKKIGKMINTMGPKKGSDGSLTSTASKRMSRQSSTTITPSPIEVEEERVLAH